MIYFEVSVSSVWALPFIFDKLVTKIYKVY